VKLEGFALWVPAVAFLGLLVRNARTLNAPKPIRLWAQRAAVMGCVIIRHFHAPVMLVIKEWVVRRKRLLVLHRVKTTVAALEAIVYVLLVGPAKFAINAHVGLVMLAVVMAFVICAVVQFVSAYLDGGVRFVR